MEVLNIHPQSPQPRLLQQAVQCLQQEGIVIYPTDSCYAMGCLPTAKKALDKIRQMRQLDNQHQFTFMCSEISEMASYGLLNNPAFRLVKSLVPGPCTFLLRATAEVPRRLQHVKRKTIGLRIPDNGIAMALVKALDKPLMTTSLIMPGELWPLNDCKEILKRCQGTDILLWGGSCGTELTTVLDLQGDKPLQVRAGKMVVDHLL